ncbi:PAS domain S-box protein [Microcoleus sp. OTE_8_concoct_300]|uniref:PAS domain S-box protein n=1 Tax=Microcoleus sp. OTE_8_concoct_300 TaxID=2964710 RepID=UPI00403FAC2A
MTKFPPEKTQSPQQQSTTAQVLRQAHFEAFFAAANAGMMILDSQLRYVQINEAMAELNGICVADHIGRSLREMLPELAVTLEPMLQEILDTGTPILDYEVGGETPKQPGILRYWQASYYPLRDENGLVFGVGAIVIEISDRKRAEKEQARLTAIVEATSDLVGVADASGNNIYLNKAGQKMLGISPEEPGYQFSINSVLAPSARAKFRDEVFPIALREGTWAGEILFVSRDGQEVPVSQVLIVHKTEAGEIEFISTIARDIRDRKKAEEERQLLVTTIENSRDFIGVASMDGRPLLMNQASLDLVGLSSLDEARTKHITDFFMAEDLDFVQQSILPAVMKEGGWRSDYRFRHFVTGQPIPVDYTLFLIKHPETNEPIAIASITRDIRDRKTAEDVLKQSEERFRCLTEATAQIIWIANADGLMAIEQPTLSAFTGQTFDNYKGWGWLDTIHSDDRAIVTSSWSAAIGNRAPYEGEFRMRRWDGEYRYMSCRAVPILKADGSIREWVGANTDITDRFQAQEALRDRNALLNSILESTPDIIVVKDREGRYVALNTNLANFYGKPIEDILGKDDSELLPPASAVPMMAKDRDIVETGTTETYEEDVSNGESGSSSFLTTKAAWRDAEGNILGIIATARNINDRKQVEADLRERNALLNSILESTPDFIVVKDREGRYVAINSNAANFLGKPIEEIIGKDDLELLPNAAREMMAKDRQIMATGITETYEEDISPDENPTTFLTTKAPWRDNQGNILGIIATTRDISDRKQAEQKLRQTLEMLDLASDAIIIRDMDDRIIYWNQGAEKLYGWTKAEVVGQYIHTFLETFFPTPLETLLAEFFDRGSWEGELHHTTCDRRHIIVASRWTLQRDGEGKPCAQLEINNDISDRKQAQDAIKQSEERYRSLIAATSQMVWTADAEGRSPDLPSWRAYTGQTEAQVVGLGWLDAIHPDDREQTNQVWMEAVQTNSLFEIEYRLRGADGNYRYFQARGVPIVNEDGSVREWVGTCTDIHDRKQAEDAIKQSEERYRSLTLAISQIVWITDPEGRCDDTPSMRAYTGQTEAQVFGFGWLDTVHPDDRELTLQVWSSAVQTKSLFEMEYRLRSADGNYRYFQARAVPILNEDGSIREWVGTSIDIHDRKQAEDAIKQSEERYRSLIAATSQIVWTADAEGRSPDLPSWRAYTGQTEAQMVGLGWLDAIHPDDQERTNQVWMEAVQTKTVFEIEYQIRRADGNYRYFQIRGVPLLDEDGSIREWIGTCTDIHDRKEAEILQAKAREAAEAASRAKSEFLANMSHELRTPLNGIMGYAQILQRSKSLNEEERSRINVIYQCGSHLLTLINDILDLAKIEAQKVELMPTDFHFPAFLQGVAEMCRIRAEIKGIHFHFPSSPELPIGIHADEKRLRQVLINLLSNAIKFTDEGSVTFIVSFATEGKLRFEIRDTGSGIAQEQLQAIFQPFEQVGDRRRHTEGTGLGLAISQRIVELMGSTIQVQSEMNVGSIFWFDVNISQADEWVKTSQIDHQGQIIGIKDRQPKIVVVDDKWANRSVISNLLSPLGFEVSEANDGQEGWEKILEVQPDLIVTDLLMPEVDGFELIKRVRESENFKDLIIIVSSASVFETDQYRSLEAGANTFIAKPVQATELLQKLQQYLELEWVYEANEAPLAIGSDTNELISPPATSMEILYELAMKGNFREIVQQAVLLEQLDPKYIPFAKRLHQMAKDFQDEEILTFIQSYK